MNTTNTIIDACDLAAYRAWSKRGVAPAYLRGVPTWVWQAALCRRRSLRHVVPAN